MNSTTLRPPLVEGPVTMQQVTDEVLRPLNQKPGRAWLTAFGLAFVTFLVGAGMVTYQIKTGIGVWGLNKTIDWGFDITNFVFWVGIGHAGTLISAILLLFRQKWRTSINRSAEAMTIFAVICAAIFPVIHMGRPWLAFWVLPYPNSRGPLWVNFRSALLWDVFAISTYFTISLVFWYVGMIPDLATVRDRVTGFRKKIYGFLSLGWNGSHRTWSRHENLCWILAGLATPLVISVHSIVSMDFATSLIPGWHTTIFPPYYVAGAIFSGFAMVMTLLIITRRVMHFEHYITLRHLDSMAKITLLTGSIVGLAYATELFIAWYSGNPYEQYTFMNRIHGPYGKAYAVMVLCNVITPQILWFKRLRTNIPVLFVLSILVNIGMWFERFVIIVVSLHRDFLPSSWTMYHPTVIEFGTLIGTFGFFFCCFLLFVRVLPAIAICEVKGVLKIGKGDDGWHEGNFLEREAKRDGDKKFPEVTGPVANGCREFLLGLFSDEKKLKGAVVHLREEGFKIHDVFTPYAVHGLDEAMGLRRSFLPIVTFLAGFVAMSLALFFQLWAAGVSWPLNVGGKPNDSVLPFLPVTFELTVLVGGLTTAASFFIRSHLYPGAKVWLSEISQDKRITDHLFVVVLEKKDASFRDDLARKIFRERGAVGLEEKSVVT